MADFLETCGLLVFLVLKYLTECVDRLLCLMKPISIADIVRRCERLSEEHIGYIWENCDAYYAVVVDDEGETIADDAMWVLSKKNGKLREIGYIGPLPEGMKLIWER